MNYLKVKVLFNVLVSTANLHLYTKESDCVLVFVCHGFLTCTLHNNKTETIKAGQYAVTPGRTLPRNTAGNVHMLRDVKLVVGQSAYSVVVTMELGMVRRCKLSDPNLKAPDFKGST